jgi:glycosyl transferase family 25
MLDIRVYVINLDRAPDRLAAMKSRLGSLPMAYERVSAVDAAHVTREEMSTVAAPRLGRLFRNMSGNHLSEEAGLRIFWPEIGRYLVAGEIACYLSHVKALQTFLASDANNALILEDDVEIDADIGDVLSVVGELPQRPRIVKLEGIQASHDVHYPVARIGARDIVMMFKPTTGAAGYCINRAGAAEIVRQALPVREPFDAFLRQYWLHGIEVLETRPFPIRQIALGTMIAGRDDQKRTELSMPYGLIRGACLPVVKLSRLLRRGIYLARSPYRLRRPRWAKSATSSQADR